MTEFLIKTILTELLFDNKICESLDDKWIVDYLYEELLLEKLLYGEPVTVPELRALLRQKILNFEFIKLNGEIRPAKGTTMMKYIPKDQHPKGIRPSSPKVATFYDLDKRDWRSVSQRSKEIVLKKDEDTQKPIIMVKDKPTGPGDVAIKDKGKEPEVEPKVPEVPEIPPEELEEPEAKVRRVKPIEDIERIKPFFFVNPETGASKTMNLTAKDAVKELKRMGKGWELQDKNEFEEKEYKEPTEDIDINKKIKEEPKTKSEDESIINRIKKRSDLENLEASEI